MKLEDIFEEYRKDVAGIKEDLIEIKIWLAKNTESLDYHIKRTNILEQKVDHVDEHVQFMKSLSKILTVSGTIVAALIGMYFSAKGMGH